MRGVSSSRKVSRRRSSGSLSVERRAKARADREAMLAIYKRRRGERLVMAQRLQMVFPWASSMLSREVSGSSDSMAGSARAGAAGVRVVRGRAAREADRKRFQGRARYGPGLRKSSVPKWPQLHLFGEARPAVLGGVKPRGGPRRRW